jgi:hypothetical protein
MKLKTGLFIFAIALLISKISYSESSIKAIKEVIETDRESIVTYLDNQGRQCQIVLNKETGKIDHKKARLGRRPARRPVKEPKEVPYGKVERLQVDIQGSSTYSRYNFTDVKKPYKNVDSWMEIKTAFWLDRNKTFAPYLSFVPSHTTDSDFWWSDYLEVSLGIQWYPIQNNPYLNSVRLFALTGKRDYYNKPAREKRPVDNNKEIGLDYYFDNLFTDFPLAGIIYLKGAHRTTNYSLNDYEAFMLEEDIKIGPKIRVGSSLIIPYGTVQSSYVDRHRNRWWENYLRAGGGLRWYPKIDEEGAFLTDLMKRFFVYAEGIRNVDWLGDDAPGKVKKSDFRFGLEFSTRGYYRD